MKAEVKEFVKNSGKRGRWRGEDGYGEFMYYERDVIKLVQSFAEQRLRSELIEFAYWHTDSVYSDFIDESVIEEYLKQKK